MDDLREKCPWDKIQTIDSLRSLTIEETYELAEAILEANMDKLKEELGDVLLHIVFYARIAREGEHFNLSEVINALCDKLVYRHPHIYADTVAETEDQVRKNWEQLKKSKNKGTGLLSGVPSQLPALVKAYRMQEKTKTVGFEWDNIDQVWDKVKEEEQELKEAIESGTHEQIELEYGDLLFSLVNYGRFLGLDPERALELVNQKFKKRFEFIELQAGDQLGQLSLVEMEDLWKKAKTMG